MEAVISDDMPMPERAFTSEESAAYTAAMLRSLRRLADEQRQWVLARLLLMAEAEAEGLQI